MCVFDRCGDKVKGGMSFVGPDVEPVYIPGGLGSWGSRVQPSVNESELFKTDWQLGGTALRAGVHCSVRTFATNLEDCTYLSSI